MPHDLIARKIEEHSSHAIFVTRWGHETLSRGLPAVRAVERIRENLHPLTELGGAAVARPEINIRSSFTDLGTSLPPPPRLKRPGNLRVS